MLEQEAPQSNPVLTHRASVVEKFGAFEHGDLAVVKNRSA